MSTGTVLLVDDEPVVLQLNAAAVRHFGFEAIIAENVEDALAMVSEYTPSLIISDVQMPGEGGFDFVKTLVEKGLKTMPTIYLTGYDDIDTIRGGLRAGGDDFIIKGVPIEEMRRRIAFWMASGFVALPAELRRRALISANQAVGDDFPGIVQYFNRKSDLVERVKARIVSELAQVRAGFGERLVERVCFMGRLSKIVMEESEEFGDYIRFPETVFEVVRQMNVSWLDDMVSLYGSFDEWALDERFCAAGPVPLSDLKT